MPPSADVRSPVIVPVSNSQSHQARTIANSKYGRYLCKDCARTALSRALPIGYVHGQGNRQMIAVENVRRSSDAGTSRSRDGKARPRTDHGGITDRAGGAS